MNVHLGIAALAGQVRGANLDATRQPFLEGYGLGQRIARKRLTLFERFELLRRWLADVQTAVPRPRRVRTLRTLLARRGFGPMPWK